MIKAVRKVIYDSGLALDDLFVMLKMRNGLSALQKEIGRSFRCVERAGGCFGGWALTKSALRSFLCTLANADSDANILELGSGQSTLFWYHMTKCRDSKIHVTTLEHDRHWGEEVQRQVKGSNNVMVQTYPLKRISDDERHDIFRNPEIADEMWSTLGTPVSWEEHENTRLHNAFYDLPLSFFGALRPIDGMIVDGPHGNGRSLAFPLFSKYLKPDAMILIDDFDHYSFLDDLGRVFNYSVVTRRRIFNKRWVLVHLDGPVK